VNFFFFIKQQVHDAEVAVHARHEQTDMLGIRKKHVGNHKKKHAGEAHKDMLRITKRHAGKHKKICWEA